jgi:hypothetical protein
MENNNALSSASKRTKELTMKAMKIVGYLMVIVALEGALQEYMWVTSAQSHASVHHAVVSHESEKKPMHVGTGYAWYEIIMMIIQGLWTLVVGAVQSIWHTIRRWIELMLIAFECSELVHKLGDRFNLWGGLHHLKWW